MKTLIAKVMVAGLLLAGSLAGAEAWTQNYEIARVRAADAGKPILAMFTGSDWCPPCKEFERDVAYSKEFLRYTTGKVVLLKLDFPQHMLQAPELIAQNEALAGRIGGEEYPRFYLLDAKGEVITKLNTRVRRVAKDYGDLIRQALDEGLAEVKPVGAKG